MGWWKWPVKLKNRNNTHPHHIEQAVTFHKLQKINVREKKNKRAKAWSMRDCLIKNLNSLSLEKKNIIASQNYVKCQIRALHWFSIRCSLLLFFLIMFHPISLYKIIIFPIFFWLLLIFSSYCCLSVICSSWIPFRWHSELQEQPGSPKPLPVILSLAALHLFYFPS